MTFNHKVRQRAEVAPKPKRYTLETHPGYGTEPAARRVAHRISLPFTHVDVRRRANDERWIPVILIRADQEWMRERLEESGVVVEQKR